MELLAFTYTTILEPKGFAGVEPLFNPASMGKVFTTTAYADDEATMLNLINAWNEDEAKVISLTDTAIVNAFELPARTFVYGSHGYNYHI